MVELHTGGQPEERTARHLFAAQRESIAQARVDIGFQPRGQRQQKAPCRIDGQRIGLCIGLCHIAQTGADKKEVAQLHTARELHVVLVGRGVAHFGIGSPIGRGDKRRKTAKVHHIEHLCGEEREGLAFGRLHSDHAAAHPFDDVPAHHATITQIHIGGFGLLGSGTERRHDEEKEKEQTFHCLIVIRFARTMCDASTYSPKAIRCRSASRHAPQI